MDSTGIECPCTMVFFPLKSSVVLDVQLISVFANPVGQLCVHCSLLLVIEGGREASGLPAASLLDEGSLSLSPHMDGASTTLSPVLGANPLLPAAGHRSGGSRDPSGASSVVLSPLSQAGRPATSSGSFRCFQLWFPPFDFFTALMLSVLFLSGTQCFLYADGPPWFLTL